MNGFIPIVPELIKTNGDDHYLNVNPPDNKSLNFLLIAMQGCPACERVKKMLQEMQEDSDLYFPAVVYYLDTAQRWPDDVNHIITFSSKDGLDVKDVPTLYLVNKRKRLIPLPFLKADGTPVTHLVNLDKNDIYSLWSH